MNIVLASRHDGAARRFADAHERFRLVCPPDLSAPGWLLVEGCAKDNVAIVGGQRIAANEIRGVLVRLPWVHPRELPHVVQEDRAYVAAETHAFLLAFLSALSCPVLNRPTASCLAGPALRPLQWFASASALGIPIPTKREPTASTAPDARPQTDLVCVTVVGETTLGHGGTALHAWARALAGHSRTSLLRAWFDPSVGDGVLVSVDLWPARWTTSSSAHRNADRLVGPIDRFASSMRSTRARAAWRPHSPPRSAANRSDRCVARRVRIEACGNHSCRGAVRQHRVSTIVVPAPRRRNRPPSRWRQGHRHRRCTLVASGALARSRREPPVGDVCEFEQAVSASPDPSARLSRAGDYRHKRSTSRTRLLDDPWHGHLQVDQRDAEHCDTAFR